MDDEVKKDKARTAGKGESVPDEDCLTYQQAAKKLQVSVDNLRHMVSQGRIPRYLKIGRSVRFKLEWLMEDFQHGNFSANPR